MKERTKALYRGKETDVSLVEGGLVGDKIATSGMLLEPYEAVIESNGEEIYDGLPDDHPEEKWMEEDEIDEGQPMLPEKDWKND